MPTPHEIVAAVPSIASGDPANKDLLRGLVVGRIVYDLNADDPTDFVAVDPATGDVPPALAYNGQLYWYDAADATTAHDGVTTLVSSDGKRFKLNTLDLRVRAVLDRTGTPPGSPSLGDAYLVIATATGDFAGQEDDIAVYTAQGWLFQTAAVGQILYVRDEDAYYHWNEAGAWAAGFGDQVLTAASVLPSNMLGGRVRWLIVNQTTNTPPSPSDGVAYIVGSSPTGAWAGHAGKIANREAGAWVIYAPVEGWEAYDQALNAPYVYDGSAWVAKSGAYLARTEERADGSAALSVTGTNLAGGYSFSTTAPTTTQSGRAVEGLTADHQAASSSSKIEVIYAATLQPAVNSSAWPGYFYLTAGIFVDSETDARDWRVVFSAPYVGANIAAHLPVNAIFVFDAPDAANHTYKIILFGRTGVATTGFTLTAIRRRLIIREAP